MKTNEKLNLFIYQLIFILIAINIQITKSELISRSLLFSDPKYSEVKLSPDGRKVAFLAANSFGIQNIYTKCISSNITKQVTFEKENDIVGNI